MSRRKRSSHDWELPEPPVAGSQAQSRHAWELPQPPVADSQSESQHAWELPPPGQDLQPLGEDLQPQPSSSSWETRPQKKQRRQMEAAAPCQEDSAEKVAGDALEALLLQLHVEGRLTATHTCLISHYAKAAGATGPVEKLALRPGAPSGHYQRHLDQVAGLRNFNFYALSVPSFDPKMKERSTMNLEMLPPHELLHKDFVDQPELKEQLAATEWPSCFADHPAAQATDEPVLPFALYLDGAQYTKVGAQVLVFAIVNLLTGCRHMWCALDKKLLCRCGCRGWCTLHPVLAFFAWSTKALCAGLFPELDHTGHAWTTRDLHRASLAKSPLACGIGACQQVRGDWAEFTHSLGFPTWHSADYPCLWCRADRDSLYDFTEDGQTLCEATSASSYDEACRRCEIEVTLETREVLLEVAGLLFYDARIYGKRGRCLKEAVPALGLKRGDRVEPSAQLPDISGFEELQCPVTVLWWRSSEETATRHRNPMFEAGTGISVLTLAVDSLHCLALGVWQVVLSAIIEAIVAHDLYGAVEAGCTTIESKLQHTSHKLARELRSWMREHPGYTAIRGELSIPLRLKGGETKTCLHFMYDRLADTLAEKLDKGTEMLKALGALTQNYKAISASGLVWSKGSRQDSGTNILPPKLQTETSHI